ncbi:AfsR/SARP family transcriptional regulator [Streptomyces litchfieldiae]|uniref:BTAD domain-containing putative transcriptional regulator n=1 Tax=Streptomyces litchfieldiae TaxID=3075543 RepID=A0ABU2MQN1_9ACTN|nr:BTAD domain-containing putative transcriptional regulator [Streptomyces sp. DSM 44938]MDT0343942.1 BTAD domain-containing putative transcriptional regulator [Streptomyces sp. DSM 44938]
MLEFRILGSVEIWSENRRLQLSGTKRPAVLGSLLLADGMPVSINRLIDAVWEDQSPFTAIKQIRNTTSDLRRLHSEIGERLTLVGDGYQLKVEDSQLDARVFTRRVAEARQLRRDGDHAGALDRFRNALSLWRGPALSGIESAALQAQVMGLNELRLSVMEERIELELVQGHHESLLGELYARVAENPLRERLAAQLMLALFRSGAQSHALAVYERTRQVLKEELDVEPGPELQECHRHITTTDSAGVKTQLIRALYPNNLPPRPVHFLGRNAEQQFLMKLSRVSGASGPSHSPHPKVIVIDGMVGIGKTALAVHVAHQFSSRYPDAQLFVDMSAPAAGNQPLDPSSALAALLSGLGVPPGSIPDGLGERSATWRRMVADRRVLILLDNVSDTRQILPLLPGVSDCLTMVTSRNRLTNGADFHQLTLQEMSPAEGRELFGRILGNERAVQEPGAVDAIVDLCGRLPLAIRIAAGKLRHRPSWPVSRLASHLAISRETRTAPHAGDDSLIEAFRQVYDDLNTLQQYIFRLLGRLPSEHVETHSVSELSGLSGTHTDQLLESFVDAHLLSTSAPGRYRMHKLLRAYAARLAGEVNASARRSGSPLTKAGPATWLFGCG